MDTIGDILTAFSVLIRQYWLYYFGITGIFVLLIVCIILNNKYKKKLTIKKIKRLFAKKPDKALKKIIRSDLDVIEYFLNQEDLNSQNYLAVKEYLSQPEQTREIFYKIIFLDNKDKKRGILKGISIFSTLSTPQAIDYLINFLYEDDREIVKMVLAELSSKQTDKVIYSLVEYINYIDDSGTLSYLQELFKKMGNEVANKLIPYIYETDPTLKIFYIDILGENINEEIYHVLTDLLHSTNPEIKIHVMKKLSNWELNEEVVDKIIELLEDKNWGVRSQSIKLLSELKIQKATPVLAKKLTDESGFVRATAAEALINFGYEGLKYLFELVKRAEAPEEIKETLKKQDIVFLIEALEHVYKHDEEQRKAISRELSS